MFNMLDYESDEFLMLVARDDAFTKAPNRLEDLHAAPIQNGYNLQNHWHTYISWEEIHGFIYNIIRSLNQCSDPDRFYVIDLITPIYDDNANCIEAEVTFKYVQYN